MATSLKIGIRIRTARRCAHMTQDELANKLNVNRATISKYESGTIEPTASQMQKIAESLNTNVEFLYGKGVCIGGNIYLDGAKKPEDMTPEELKEFMVGMPKAFEEVRKAFGDLADVMLDYHADGDVLLLQYYNMLNHKGRKEAIKRTAELSRQEEYTAPDDPTEPK